MNITLIGMPGSGKSFIGKKLSEKLGYTLIELDAIMEKDYNEPLQKILDTLGEEVFLRKQEEDAINHTNQRDNLIISPGGSIVYTEKAMGHLKKISHIVYLKAGFETVRGRIEESSRGIVGLKDKTFKQLYDERSKLYSAWATTVLDAEREAELIVSELLHIDGLSVQ